MRNDRVDPHQCRSGANGAGLAPARSGPGGRAAPLFDAVLFDRDGTLVHDVPYNGDPELVRPVDGARAALDRLRDAGLRLGVVTNQSGLARGRFTAADLARVHARLECLLGPFDAWQTCPHASDAGCECRKPAPGMVVRAARELGTTPARCVLVGDIGADMTAAAAAGATGILVPTPVTRSAEVAAAPEVATDLADAVERILRRQRLFADADTDTDTDTDTDDGTCTGTGTGTGTDPGGGGRRRRCVLVARTDSAGDVLVTGPAIRAVAAGAERVVMLCGPRGRAAAELLPGVDELIESPLPWIDPRPEPVDRAGLDRLVRLLAGAGADEAVLFTSYHQSALPLALLLRMAGVGRISAISDDYPGALLDVRHRVPAGVPEAERALSLAAAAGFRLPAGDEPVLRIRTDRVAPATVAPATAAPAGAGPAGAGSATAGPDGDRGYVVVHPGSSVPARGCPPEVSERIVAALAAAGHRVLVTGGPGERALTARVAGRYGVDLGGRTSLTDLAAVLRGAGCLVVANTGPAHLAAALGVPVVSLFAPTVPFGQWRPYRVPVVRLGAAAAPCRDSRATECPVPGHPCLASVDPAEVVAAVRLLGLRPAPSRSDRPVPVPGMGPAGGPPVLAGSEVAS